MFTTQVDVNTFLPSVLDSIKDLPADTLALLPLIVPLLGQVDLLSLAPLLPLLEVGACYLCTGMWVHEGACARMCVGGGMYVVAAE